MTVEPERLVKHTVVFDAFKAFLDYLSEIEKVYSLSMHAMKMLQGSGRLAEVLAEVKERKLDDEAKQRIELTKKLEMDAEAEAASGFPLLTSHSVVALWSALEETIPRLCVDWLLTYPKTLEREEFAKVRLPSKIVLIEDRSLLIEEIVFELNRATLSSLKAGIGRFDALIGALGIQLNVSADLRRDLFELSKVRNVIVHQFGKADRKFVQECPWLNCKAGERLRLGPDQFQKYNIAVREYCVRIIECGRVELTRLQNATDAKPEPDGEVERPGQRP